MINKNFKENWRQILNFNSKVEILKNPQETTEKVRIPLTPVSINSYILYFLVETLYPKFINDQQNILDIFYSNGSSETASMNAILYETSKAGIHESMIKIPTDLIPNEQITRENIQEVFDEIQPAIIKHYGTKISGVRVFTAKTLDLINLYCQNLDFTSNGKYIPHIIDLFQDLIQEDLIVISQKSSLNREIRKSFRIPAQFIRKSTSPNFSNI